jgi:hypothetical protein
MILHCLDNMMTWHHRRYRRHFGRLSMYRRNGLKPRWTVPVVGPAVYPYNYQYSTVYRYSVLYCTCTVLYCTIPYRTGESGIRVVPIDAPGAVAQWFGANPCAKFWRKCLSPPRAKVWAQGASPLWTPCTTVWTQKRGGQVQCQNGVDIRTLGLELELPSSSSYSPRCYEREGH